MSNLSANGAWLQAVQQLNTQGSKSALSSYGVLHSSVRTDEDKENRSEVLSKLNTLGRTWYMVAALQDFVIRAKLPNSVFKPSFGGIRVMCAVPAKGTFYLLALDVAVDVNGGTVVTQWVTKQPVSQQNIPKLLEAKAPELRQSELGTYFERYSTINAVAGSIRRTPEGMEKFVIKVLTERLKQMRG